MVSHPSGVIWWMNKDKTWLVIILAGVNTLNFLESFDLMWLGDRKGSWLVKAYLFLGGPGPTHKGKKR